MKTDGPGPEKVLFVNRNAKSILSPNSNTVIITGSEHQLPKFQDDSEIHDLYDDFSVNSFRHALFSIVQFDKLSPENITKNGQSIS